MSIIQKSIAGIVLLSILTLHTCYADRIPYRVSPQGEDSLSINGIEQSWRSIGYALSRLSETGGVTIQVATGSYPPISTTRQFLKPVTIQASAPHQATIQPGTNCGPVLFNSARNIVLDGFLIDNQNNPNVSNALHILKGASDITIRNCIITHGDSGYINADAVKIHLNVHDVLLEKNVILNACDELVELSGWVHDIALRGNVFYQDPPHPQKPMLAFYDYVWRIVLDSNVFINQQNGRTTELVQLGRNYDLSSDEQVEDIRDIALINNTFALASLDAPILSPGGENRFEAGNVFSHSVYTFQSEPEKDTRSTFAIQSLHVQEQIPPNGDNLFDWLTTLCMIHKDFGLRISDYFHLSEYPLSIQNLLREYFEKYLAK